MEQPASTQDSAVVDVPATQPADTTTAAPTDDPDQALLEQIEADPTHADDEVEDEIDGVKARGKKELIERLKNERLMQADYTRKTQEVAQQRQQLQQQAQFSQQFLEEAATLKAIDHQLQQYGQINWNGLIDSDPAQAQKLQLARDQLVRNREQVVQSLYAKQAQTLQQQQAGLAALKEQAAAYLAREIAGMSPERDAAIAKYILAQGVPSEALPNVMAHMPQFGVMAHKAELYDKLVAKATKKPPPEPQSAPVTRVAATNATASKDPSKMSDAEFAKWRRSQIAQRR